MLNEKEHLIWSNYYLDLEDWRESLEESYPGYSDDGLYEEMINANNDELDCERDNLNIRLSRPIIVIANLGLWNGRFSGYHEIRSGNIGDCLYSEADYCTWYVDEYGDLRCSAVHHDGTNRYLYRVYRDSATESGIRRFKDKIFDGKCTEEDIKATTKRLGDEIGRVYGWTFPKRIRKHRENENGL